MLARARPGQIFGCSRINDVAIVGHSERPVGFNPAMRIAPEPCVLAAAGFVTLTFAILVPSGSYLEIPGDEVRDLTGKSGQVRQMPPVPGGFAEEDDHSGFSQQEETRRCVTIVCIMSQPGLPRGDGPPGRAHRKGNVAYGGQ
jgi:hypothetical protein